jgi:hypothetical protein
MDKNVFTTLLLKDIKLIEQKIGEIALLDKNKAQFFSDNLTEFKSAMLQYDNEDSISQKNLAELIVELNNNINDYLSTEGKEIQNKNQVCELKNDISKISDTAISTKDLLEISKKWKNINLSPLKKSKLNQALSKKLLSIFKSQIANNEEIRIGTITTICDSNEFINIFKNELISNNLSSNYFTIDLIDSLTINNLEDSKYWEALTGKTNIKISTKSEEQNPEIIDSLSGENQPNTAESSSHNNFLELNILSIDKDKFSFSNASNSHSTVLLDKKAKNETKVDPNADEQLL